MNRKPLLALVGPTASGKTRASLVVAEALSAEIVNFDSTSLFRGMDVGTAKPTVEDRTKVRHHLVDLVEPRVPFSVAEYQRLARAAIADIRGRGRAPLLVGGSGLYYRAVVDTLEFPGTLPSTRALLEAETTVLGVERLHQRLMAVDPAAARRIGPGNARRTVRALEVAAVTGRPFSSFSTAWHRYPPEAVRAAGIDVPRPTLHRWIKERATAVMPLLIEETEALMERGFGPFIESQQVIGYAEAVMVIRGELAMREALSRTVRRVKSLARHQLAWFRRDPRIRWFNAPEGAVSVADQVVEYLRGGVQPVGVPSRSGVGG